MIIKKNYKNKIKKETKMMQLQMKIHLKIEIMIVTQIFRSKIIFTQKVCLQP